MNKLIFIIFTSIASFAFAGGGGGGGGILPQYIGEETSTKIVDGQANNWHDGLSGEVSIKSLKGVYTTAEEAIVAQKMFYKKCGSSCVKFENADSESVQFSYIDSSNSPLTLKKILLMKNDLKVDRQLEDLAQALKKSKGTAQWETLDSKY